MEIWNPVDRTVSTIVDKLPREITTSQMMYKFSMTAIRNNTEILTIGGWASSYLSGLDYLKSSEVLSFISNICLKQIFKLNKKSLVK